MLDHVSIQCQNAAASAAFYDEVLAPLGGRRVLSFGPVVGYGTDEPDFWIGPTTTRGEAREAHLAFTAPDRAAVDAFFEEAVRQHAEVLHPPGLRPEYHEHYYAAFVRDPDGNNVEAVCHDPALPRLIAAVSHTCLMPDEEPLHGGYVNNAVRKGASVRRVVGPNTTFVHRLLRYFEAAGWHHAPHVLGFDTRGREKLSFIEGDAAIDPDRSAYAESDAALTRLAVLVREFHDLAADPALSGDAETVCHNDLSPKNTIYTDATPGALPVAIIDWDGAAPGERIHDLAHLCWQHLRLGPAATDIPETARRMRLICDAYGLDAAGRGGLIDAVLWWQERCWRGIETEAAAGDPAKILLRDAGAPAWIRACRAWVTAHRGELEAAL
jgi:catechol 2,3-dioxygenase-like lactoylglutathione lyase family enzyme